MSTFFKKVKLVQVLSPSRFFKSGRTCQLVTLLLIYIGLGSCANQGTLSGGKKDETPPVMIAAESTPNLQTNFKKQNLKFTFNEWLQLKDVFNQVVISPPLQEKFEVKLKKKTVRFEFHEKEVLRENATYTINFGDAVKDLTEGNPVKDFRFVFSTGDFIDSLEVQGKIQDAFSKEPVKDVIVMLYDNLADTVVRTEKPFYFGKTDESGLFKIKNVRADTFKVFALIDGNLNYLFDSKNEKIGFLDEPIVVTDSTKVNVEIRLFQEEPAIRLLKENVKRYGHVNFEFNRKPFEGEVEITFQDVGQKTYLQPDKDSLKLWYDLPQDTAWNIFVKKDTLWSDTILVKKISRANFLSKKELIAAGISGGKKPIHPRKPLIINFNHPLEKVDTSFITLLEDTLLRKVVPTVTIDSTNRRNLWIQYKFKENIPYRLELLPGALTDFFGLKNDTLQQSIDILSTADFGDIILTVKDMQPEKSYVLELLDKSDNLVETLVMTGDTIFQKTISSLEAGTYSVRLIQDANGNGRWDTGNYDNNIQPETIFTRKLEELRAGWELNATVSFDEKPTTVIPNNTSPEDGDLIQEIPNKGKNKK